MSRRAIIYQNGVKAGILEELSRRHYIFNYDENYAGRAISLTMPVSKSQYEFTEFPPVFEGLLPEGQQLEALLINEKLDRKDLFSQLITVGKDMVGTLTIELLK